MPSSAQEIASVIWVQAGALGLLLLFGIVVIMRLWHEYLKVQEESREDRVRFLMTLQQLVERVEGIHTDQKEHGQALTALRELLLRQHRQRGEEG